MRKHIWIGVLFALVCLYFAFRGISLRQLWESLSHAHPWPILLALGIYGLEYRIRATRWAILLRPVSVFPASELFWPLIIGFFANNILPLRMGEFVRAHISGTKLKISRTASLGSILIERICDTLSFLATFLVASLFYPFPHYMEKGAWILAGVCFLVILVLILIRRHEESFRKVLFKSPLPLLWKAKAEHVTTHFIHSTSGITQPRYVAEAMALSLTIWVLEGTFLFLIAHAFALNLQYAGAYFLLFALGLSVTLPQAPGYVGTFELFGVTALTLLGFTKGQGLPVVLAIHGTQFLFIALLGSIGLWKEGLTFRSLTSTDA